MKTGVPHATIKGWAAGQGLWPDASFPQAGPLTAGEQYLPLAQQTLDRVIMIIIK